MSEHPYNQGRKGNQKMPLATWMVAAGETIIDLRKIMWIGPLTNGGIHNHYTVAFVGGSEMTILDNGGLGSSQPALKR